MADTLFRVKNRPRADSFLLGEEDESGMLLNFVSMGGGIVCWGC